MGTWGDYEEEPEEEPQQPQPPQPPSGKSSKSTHGGAKRSSASSGAAAAGQGTAQQLESNEGPDGDWLKRWVQLTLQRLSAELARQPDAAAKRNRLRNWQRMFHPDKNPGRESEVQPIFRWVQDGWNREFRSASA